MTISIQRLASLASMSGLVSCSVLGAAIFLTVPCSVHGAQPERFEQEADIGDPAHPGRMSFDAAANAYAISGGGENMWFTNDSFHFAYKQISGDFALQTGVEWQGAAGNAHRKACLMVRQTLAADS